MPDPARSRDGPDGPDDADADARDGGGDVVRNEDDDSWRFEIAESGGGSDDAEERPPLEPGRPSAENVFFVLVGVALTLLLLLSVFVPLPLVA